MADRYIAEEWLSQCGLKDVWPHGRVEDAAKGVVDTARIDHGTLVEGGVGARCAWAHRRVHRQCLRRRAKVLGWRRHRPGGWLSRFLHPTPRRRRGLPS